MLKVVRWSGGCEVKKLNQILLFFVIFLFSNFVVVVDVVPKNKKKGGGIRTSTHMKILIMTVCVDSFHRIIQISLGEQLFITCCSVTDGERERLGSIHNV